MVTQSEQELIQRAEQEGVVVRGAGGEIKSVVVGGQQIRIGARPTPSLGSKRTTITPEGTAIVETFGEGGEVVAKTAFESAEEAQSAARQEFLLKSSAQREAEALALQEAKEQKEMSEDEAIRLREAQVLAQVDSGITGLQKFEGEIGQITTSPQATIIDRRAGIDVRTEIPETPGEVPVEITPIDRLKNKINQVDNSVRDFTQSVGEFSQVDKEEKLIRLSEIGSDTAERLVVIRDKVLLTSRPARERIGEGLSWVSVKAEKFPAFFEKKGVEFGESEIGQKLNKVVTDALFRTEDIIKTDVQVTQVVEEETGKVLDTFSKLTGEPVTEKTLKAEERRLELERKAFVLDKGLPVKEAAELTTLIALALGVSAVKGGFGVVRHPLKTLKALGTQVLFPLKTLDDLATSIQERPVTTIGELIGVGKVIGVGGRKISAVLPEVKFETIKLPTEKGEVPVFKGVSIGGRPIIGKAEGKVVVLKTGVVGKDVVFKKFVPETKLETRIARQVAEKKFEVVELEKFDKSIDILKTTEKVTSKFKTDIAKETKTLSEKGVAEVLKFAREQEAQVFGSFAAAPQLPPRAIGIGRKIKPGLPEFGDIDIHLRKQQVSADVLAKNLVERLKKVGEDVRIAEGKPTLIEARRKVKGIEETAEFHHAVDIKSFEDVIDIDIPLEGALGFKFKQPSIKRQKLKLMRLSEFGLRKGASIFTFREKGFAPQPHRLKDIPDFFTAQEFLLKSKFLPQKKRLKKLQEVKDLFDVKEPGEFKIEISPPTIKRGSKFVPISTAPSLKISSPKFKVPSISPSMIPSIPRSISPGISPRPSVSPSAFLRSISPSIGTSPSMSPGVSPSILSPSFVPSISPSISPGTSVTPSPSLVPSPGFPDVPKIKMTIISPSLKVRSLTKKKRPGFNVFVKSRGKFRRANRESLPFNLARNRGAAIVDEYPAASFILRKTKKKTNILDDKAFFRKIKFRLPKGKTKLPKRTLIEKNKFRIDSVNELLSIPYKGLEVLKAKRKKTRRKKTKKKR